MSDTTQTEVTSTESKQTWLRGLFMLLFIILFGIAETVLALMAVVQFFWLLFAKEPNAFLRDFGASLGRWMRDVANFQTGGTEEKPFPWKNWPSAQD